MSAFKEAQAQAVLNYTLRGGQRAITMPVKVMQMSTTPTATTAGVELSGGGFTAGGVAITFNAPTAGDATYSAFCGNAALTITNAPAGTQNGVLLVDSTAAPAAPNELMWGALTTARTFAAGDTLSYPADAIQARV